MPAKLIGPRRPSGSFYKKRPATKKPRARVARPSKPLQSAIKTVLNRQLETKYVAEQVQLSGYAIPADISPNIDFHTMLPKLPIQTGVATNNQREGDTVEPIKARISGHIWLDQSPSVAKVVYAKLFMVTPKAIKSNQTPVGGTNPNAALPDGLLCDGTDDPVAWLSNAQDLQAFFPISKENYTVMKCKTFKFTNNGGAPVGQAVGSFTNIGSDRYSFTYSWKPPKLKYALDADVYPSNHNPVFFAVIYSPGFNCATDASLISCVKMNWNLDLFYKDA